MATVDTSRDGAGFEAENRKYPFTIASWDDYHTFRPMLPPSMFASWLQYHDEHDGKYDAVHDIGAGTYVNPSIHIPFD